MMCQMQNFEAESDELYVTNNEVYQDVSLESNSIFNDMKDTMTQLYRDDVDSITLEAHVIELEAQAKHEVGYDEEDSDQKDDIMVEYISNHEKNEGSEGHNSTSDGVTDSINNDDDIKPHSSKVNNLLRFDIV